MKNVFLLTVAALAGLASPASAQLDLTPSVGERLQEGKAFPELRFSDSGKKVTYEQPRGWTHSAQSPQKIAFKPPSQPQTKAEMESGFPLIPAQFDEEGVKQLKATFSSLLPKDSAAIEVVAEQKNPLLINGRETYEITASFTLNSHHYRLSVMFVNLEREQLRCRVIARPEDFEQAHRAFLTSLYGMQWSP